MLLESLIGSTARIKIIRKLFLNPAQEGYLRGLEEELGESSNSIRIELNRLLNADLLVSWFQGNRRYFKANVRNPYFDDLQGILKREAGLDVLTEGLESNLPELEAIYLSGDLSRGLETGILDLLLVGRPNPYELVKHLNRLEKLNGRKIRFIIFQKKKDKTFLKIWKVEKPLLLWEKKK